MYAEHVPQLATHGKASPQGLANLCTFALASIRQQFNLVPRIVSDIRRQGEKSGHLWGWKLAGYKAAHGDAGAKLWRDLAGVAYAEDAIAAIMLAIPGLGISKAGFVASMLGYDVGCMDSRNLARLGYSPRVWRDNGHGKASALKKIPDYVACCREHGGAETLWDDWCSDYAMQSGLFYNADDISAMHLYAMKDNPQRKGKRQ